MPTWGYLSEFWDLITQVDISPWEYSVDFFKGIGNAVAGAVGSLFEFLNHSLSDVFVFGGWFVSVLGNLLTKLWLPVNYIFSFFSAFVERAFATPEPQNIWSFSTSTKAVFSAIPYWDTTISVLGVSILIIVGMAIFKQFLKT